MNLDRNTSSRKRLTRFIYLFLVLALLAAAAPISASAAPAAQTVCATKHTVVSGETLSSIGVAYGVDWQDIAEANNLKDPYTLTIGQVLCIPGSAADTPEEGEGDDQVAAGGPTFTVTFDDNNFMNIKTIGYPKSMSFIVRVSPLELRWGWLELEVIGRFSTDKNGGSDALIRVPKEYRDQDLYICLKNATTDKIQCDVFSPFE